jgi:demethylmenaquinone methyltransferase/2-methoxy-6-polyprenyl-1,4-benzoquinol methylase
MRSVAVVSNASEARSAERVRAMFDRVAPRYDVLNHVMSAGLHHRWRSRTADLLDIAPGARVLDVACGTGDLSIELERRVGRAGEVIGCDFSLAMLDAARAKAPAMRFEHADALRLPYSDGEFDAAAVGFGARNFADLGHGLAEMARVVRVGGRVAVLEFTTPERFPLSMFFRLWLDVAIPLLGKVSSNPDAYGYLARSVRSYPAPAEVAARLARCGVNDVRWIVTGGGIVTIHVGTRR